MLRLFKYPLSFLTLTCFSFFSFSQTNLVPNPSFEDTLNCSANYATPEAAYPWFSANLSPDYYSSISACGFSVPNFTVGFQMPRTGLAYTGIFCYEVPCGMEYFEVMLDSALAAGKKYCVSFYVSLANTCDYSIDKIGAHFSNDTIMGLSACYLPYIPQVENSSMLTDTLNWKNISGNFIASGGERYLTIGVFHDNNNITIGSMSGGSFSAAYYYVDDVSVYWCDTVNSTSEFYKNYEINISPNPASDLMNIYISNNISEFKNIRITNIVGEEVFSISNTHNRDFHLDFSDKPAGLYFLTIYSNKNVFTSKILILKNK